ncbi:hypothetical protein E5288_WYG003696 [Bos mutus]|uniref:Uncharacterized protein n=1 Tax=Bos mutus TaxID=72004 RepID=A0A6B0RVK2_9CETA|nr:hypothetical protein [Bos mutus]
MRKSPGGKDVLSWSDQQRDQQNFRTSRESSSDAAGDVIHFTHFRGLIEKIQRGQGDAEKLPQSRLHYRPAPGF